jgi:hypothetical protein
MKRFLSAALALSLCLGAVGLAHAAPLDAPGTVPAPTFPSPPPRPAAPPAPPAPAASDLLPSEDTLKWDVRAMEDNADAHALIKRTTGPREVNWTVRINSDAEVQRLYYYSPVSHLPQYYALFQDADGVTVQAVLILPSTRDARIGENVRYRLTVPGADVLSRSASVVIRLR